MPVEKHTEETKKIMSEKKKGNQNGVKLKSPNIRQQAYDDFCAHIALGKSKKSWYFEHQELTCTWETFEKYTKDEIEFDPIKIKVSNSKGLKKWEQISEDAATGVNKDANTASLQMVMRNKFGWDKQKHIQSDYRADIGKLADEIRKRPTE